MAPDRLEKFKNRAKMIVSPEHLAKIMATFPKSQHKEIRKAIAHRVKGGLLKKYDEFQSKKP